MNVNIGELLKKLKSENIEMNERAAGELKAAALKNAADFQTTETGTRVSIFREISHIYARARFCKIQRQSRSF